MPRKVDRKVPDVPWAEALAMAGSFDRLIGGVHYKTWKGWEGKLVPGHRLARLFIEQWRAEQRPGPPEPPDDPELVKALALVRQLYRLKTDHHPPRREHDWRVLMALLDAPPESDRERRRSQRP